MKIIKFIKKYNTNNFINTFWNILLFIIFSGVTWWVSNGFSVADPEGFDPLRYEYYAVNGLPQDYMDSSSYKIVSLLEYIYIILPQYIGFLVIMAVLAFSLRYYDYSKFMSIAIYSPITFYYISQTGKDGISILAMIAITILAVSKKNIGIVLVSVLIITLSFYVRPAIILIIPILLVQYFYGTLYALIACPLVGAAFYTNSDLFSVVKNLETLVSDDGAGKYAQLIREYTLGYELFPIIYKIILFSVSFIFQPMMGFVKYYNGSSAFVLLESFCYTLFTIVIIRKNMILKFLLSSLPYAVILGLSSPFYHFRYLAIVYPVIWLYCRNSSGWGFLQSGLKDTEAAYKIGYLGEVAPIKGFLLVDNN